MTELKLPLTNIQTELMKLYSTNLSDPELDELKTVLSAFYAGKAIRKADEIWDNRNLTDAHMEEWLNKKS